MKKNRVKKCSHPKEKRRGAGHRRSVTFCTHCGSIGQWNGWGKPWLWIAPELTRDVVAHPTNISRLGDYSDSERSYPDVAHVSTDDWQRVSKCFKQGSVEWKVLRRIRNDLTRRNVVTGQDDIATMVRRGKWKTLAEFIRDVNAALPCGFALEHDQGSILLDVTSH